MSDNTNGDTAPEADRASGESAPPPGPSANTGGMQAVINHLSQDKIEAALWISRLATILFTVSFVLPIFGYVAVHSCEIIYEC